MMYPILLTLISRQIAWLAGSSTVYNVLRKIFCGCCARNIHYVQGQSPEPKIREYFYYVNHQGELFLDDAKMKNFTSCFKEKKFLDFFFQRLRLNETNRYKDFPYLSPCGHEHNYIRCDDKPIVYVHLTENSDHNQPDVLSYGYAGTKTLCVPFQPEKIFMAPESGRIYHPANPEVGGVGLVKSNIAIVISKYFEFEQGEDHAPSHFMWKGRRYELKNELQIIMKMNPFEARKRLHEQTVKLPT